jgi:hypothetical protein
MGALAYPRDIPTTLKRYKNTIFLAGLVPANADVTGVGWVAGDRGFGIGTDSSFWWMLYDGVNVNSVQLT